ncbi:osmoprotectant transport system substrate-binding protein [Tistlia consotensis]|uniref:Osmoprotectant transport system substrate-binding protein/osmoprotectant transport system permease protein n=1 Tax=Tistlia consotensis USBA 355 TaxID=560819 RepID=A0A1Y6B7U1_9PROT|nr:glycine betaine ABC transporter substrate-binding protein [Tistlia consotensis]SME88795.1 osmoprotectant transport system substrate-binding protein/osmoprotectant transport system permease protein [Tistlia consotensis USBA 355]SNR25331.1 osmoprotectant transport system substrate-binding protein [Tistlia consotensis]
MLEGSTRRTVLAGAALLASLSLFGPAQAADKLTVGSKNYTESIVVTHMLADLLEAKGYEVDRKIGLGGTSVIHEAIVSGEIDLYPEYTGTALLAILKHKVVNDPDEAYGIVKAAYAEQFGLTWLKPLGFNDTYALAMRRADTEKLGIASLSDLATHAGDLTLGSTQEFLVRPDALPGLSKTYGMAFKGTRGMDPGLVYQAIAGGNVDVISVFTTDGRIKANDLTVLKDDKRFFPPYYLTPVVRSQTLAAHPDVADALNALAGKIDEATMVAINSAIDQGKRPAEAVAREFLQKAGLLH